jgi:hypothetical protein
MDNYDYDVNEIVTNNTDTDDIDILITNMYNTSQKTSINDINTKIENLKIQTDTKLITQCDTRQLRSVSTPYTMSVSTSTNNQQSISTFIYIIYSKDNKGIKILNKAFYHEKKAYDYVLNKIKTLLNIINDEFKERPNRTLPLGAQVIYVIFQQKYGIDQYDYFKENYIKYFQYVCKEPLMFFVSKLNIID